MFELDIIFLLINEKKKANTKAIISHHEGKQTSRVATEANIGNEDNFSFISEDDLVDLDEILI